MHTKNAVVTFVLLVSVLSLMGIFGSWFSDPLHRSPTYAFAQTHPVTADQDRSGQAASPSSHPEGGHADPFASVLLQLGMIVVAAIAGRWVARKLNMASVLGELLIGVIVGNIGIWLGRPVFLLIMHMERAQELISLVATTGVSLTEAGRHVFTPEQLAAGGIGERIMNLFGQPEASKYLTLLNAVWVFSNMGVILLLFMVGLESSVGEMIQVGPQSLKVAIVGVIAPFVLGYGAGVLLLPAEGTPVHLFLAATLCATSVGITARVFKDLNRIQTPEAKIILGAAVIDDILGLVILAVVVGIVATGTIILSSVATIAVVSLAFLIAVMLIGEKVVHWLLARTTRFEPGPVKLLYPLVFAFLMAWFSSVIGLAAIVGAFAAGLLLKDEYFAAIPGTHMTIQETVAPLEAVFAPVFFVLMGMQVDLATFGHMQTILLALAFVVVAILGKAVAGYAVRGVDRLSIGIGMVPRGEVGLIFASIGKGLGVVSDSVFSAIVIMVMVTTLITPLGLKWSLFRNNDEQRRK